MNCIIFRRKSANIRQITELRHLNRFRNTHRMGVLPFAYSDFGAVPLTLSNQRAYRETGNEGKYHTGGRACGYWRIKVLHSLFSQELVKYSRSTFVSLLIQKLN